ncbi:toxin-antitoxin system YwqK family antitoxin [Chryseolinea lacunae]|uniref:Toxin-antitoxin system YwqK family antitoxin n=1 Tax=Chryseolinea lacunae TaxID=2801331 RepID=A0ABS1KLQ4_9BACT|nr:hypothetical protein [Chryseolinea lacunae]MBL0740403.1 hypothetical protein [Chryseolinea lacunae]
MKKIILVLLLNTSWVGLTSAQQTVLKYPHCNCVEKITLTETEPKKPNGPYEWVCNEVVVEKGQYKDGVKDGQWTNKSGKGVVIARIDYDSGKLNGDYELFHSDGTTKLVAHFDHGAPEGTWQYFNTQGKIIKTGAYHAGKPVGLWTIYDKLGRKALLDYDFDQTSMAPGSVNPYYKNDIMIHDDQSGEYVILYYPDRTPRAEIQPLGGYLLANDYFVQYFTIPPVMMDTYVKYDFVASVAVDHNVVKDINVLFRETMPYYPHAPSFPYIVSTNGAGKLQRVTHSVLNLKYLRSKIQETLLLMGPWLGTTSTPVEIHVPFVLNDLKKF